MSDDQNSDTRVDALQKRIAKLEKINRVLIEEADRRAQAEQTSYELFRTASVLEETVAMRTARLKEAQQRLEQSLSLVRATLDSTADGILVASREGKIVDYNDKALKLWNVPDELIQTRDQRQFIAHAAHQLKDPDAYLARLLELHQHPDMEAFDELLFNDGRIVECYSMPHRIGGETVGRVSSFRDVTERRRSEDLSARLGRILDSSSNEIYVFRADTLHFTQVNESARRNLGYTLDQLKQLTPVRILAELNDAAFAEKVAPLREGTIEELIFESNHQRCDGSLYPVEVHLQLSRAEQPAVFVAIVLDISERKRANERLRYLANYDSLTGLPNRMLFRDRLAQALARAQRQNTHAALIFMDLDRFKSVNDTLGHSAGDKLLQAVSERIKGCLRSVDTFARLGGDEFTIVVSDIPNPDAAAIVARKILETFKRPFSIEGHDIYSSASIGITVYPNDAKDIENLLRNADSAMYLAKEQGRGNYQFFTSEMNTKVQERLVLENNLRRAQENGEFQLHYQPQVNLATGNFIGFEALLRWQHPEFGMLAPDKFIPIAEETGMIVAIGEWALRTACRQWRQWSDAGLSPQRMSVNMSARQFRQPDIATTLSNVLHETGMRAAELELEMTEGSLMTNTDASRDTLEKLKALGIKLAIDDFGTGYSSLNYLKRFPIDTLKIDRSFVRDISTDPNDAAITQAIIALAHALHITAVAEGVETEEQRRFLQQQNCHAAQGFLFGRPVPADVAVNWLRRDDNLLRFVQTSR